MAKTSNTRPEARLPKGFRDSEAADVRAQERMLATIAKVFESYGFEPLDSPAIEFTEALGKFLPDQDRPNAGVFSFRDEDEQWLSLRYDLTAPLARYVAENFDRLPKPFRRYAAGPVWRNEKPGPGRYRQFLQFDADTVGTDSVAADAEMCMLLADTLEALGVARGQYVVKVNSRKVLDALLAHIGLGGEDNAGRRLMILRAIDKLDRLGPSGVRALLGKGRMDESGDFTHGARLDSSAIDTIVAFVTPGPDRRPVEVDIVELFSKSDLAAAGMLELMDTVKFAKEAGYDLDRVRMDNTVVRGLEYYTGPVFEAELTFPITNEDGETVRFGSVGGGGRYDDLIARFTGQRVPATGFSIGVSRLQTALAALGRTGTAAGTGPVVVLVMDRPELPRYQRLSQTLRAAGIRAEMYLGAAGMKAQMKYADKRGAPCVVIQGGDERARGEVQVKDLIEGARAAAAIKDSKEWREGRPAQVSVPEADLVATVRAVLARHQG